MRRLLGICVLLLSTPLFAQIGAVQNHCYLGGVSAVTSSLSSTNKLQGIVPSCTVTVYLTGTTTIATIYSDSAGAPLSNPFPANALGSIDPGGWIFWAATNVGLDVVMSGGISPNTYTQPVTLTDVFPSQSFSPVSGVVSMQGTAPITVNGISGTPETGNITVACITATNSVIGCSRPDGTTITASAGVLSVNPAIVSTIIKVNGTATTLQSPVNFSSTTPAAPSGTQNCAFQQDGSGNVSCNVPLPTNNFAMANTPPTTGQSILLKPASCAVTYGGDNTNGIGACASPVSDPVSGLTVYPGGSISCPNAGPLAACDTTITFGFTLPSYIVQANITAVYQTSTSSSNGNANYSLVGMKCSPGTHYADPQNGGSLNFWVGQQYTALWTSGPPTVNSVTCTASQFASISGTNGASFWSMVGLYVYYTGTAPPSSNFLNVNLPLMYTPNNLYLSLPYNLGQDTTNTNNYVVTIPAYTAPNNFDLGDGFVLVASNANTSTTVTVQVNGHSYSVVKCGSSMPAIGDIAANKGAVMNFDGTDLDLTNPASGCGGGSVGNALTGAASGGASPGATFNGSAAVTFDYHTLGATAPTGSITTGHCAEWASGNTLEDAGAACGSGGGGLSFPATVSGTATSGGIPYFNSTTQLSSSGILNSNVMVKGGGAGTAPTNSSVTDNGTTVTTADTGGFVGPSFNATGSSAGYLAVAQGTTNTGSIPTNSILFQAPTSVTAFAVTLPGAPASGVPLWSVSGGNVTESIVPRAWSCQPGLGDGLNAIAAGTYLQSTCKNTTGVTVTLTGVQCYTDSGSSTMNAAGNTLGALLTGAINCTSSFTAGTQSSNVALTNGDYIKFTFVADGTTKQTTWVVTGTY